MATRNPKSVIPKAPDRAAPGSMAQRRHGANVAMEPARDAGGTGLRKTFANDPAWSNPDPKHDPFTEG